MNNKKVIWWYIIGGVIASLVVGKFREQQARVEQQMQEDTMKEFENIVRDSNNSRWEESI